MGNEELEPSKERAISGRESSMMGGTMLRATEHV